MRIYKAFGWNILKKYFYPNDFIHTFAGSNARL